MYPEELTGSLAIDAAKANLHGAMAALLALLSESHGMKQSTLHAELTWQPFEGSEASFALYLGEDQVLGGSF